MSDSAIVSVVIPVYNAEAFIDEALESIFAQDYPSFEVIVVNDGSTDATAQRIATHGDKVRFFEQPNSGGFPGSPRNLGLQHSRGEFICFLDADDIMLPGRLRLQADLLREHFDVGVVFGDYQNFTENGHVGSSHFATCPLLTTHLRGRPTVVLGPSDATSLLLRENVGGAGTMMIRRQALEEAPEFSLSFRIGEDFHFYYRILRRFSLGIANQVTTLRRIHDSNVTGDPLSMLHNVIASRSALCESEHSEENLAALREVVHSCEITLARAYANQGDFGRSITYNLRAMTGGLPRRPHWIAAGLRGLVRTAAIAMNLKRPSS